MSTIWILIERLLQLIYKISGVQPCSTRQTGKINAKGVFQQMNVVMLRPITSFPGVVDYNFGAFCAIVSTRPIVFCFSEITFVFFLLYFTQVNQEKVERDCSVSGTT